MKKTITILLGVLCILIFSDKALAKKKYSFFQITVYHFNSADQEQVIDTYLKNALLPVYHKSGNSSVGVFKPIANDTASDKRVYVLRAIKNLDQLVKENVGMQKDEIYLNAAAEYLNTAPKNPSYLRMENILIKSFDVAPKLILPMLSNSKSEHIYELRSYEGATEKLFNNKVEMFNKGGEVSLFKRLNFNAVFYGEVLAGSRMPNLMYMTSFENMADRDAHWNAFRVDEQWKTLSAMPQYQNNVSKIDINLLKATAYSDY